MEADAVLPGNAGPFERILAEVNRRVWEAEIALAATLRSLWDPWTCPEAELKRLAWAHSVDIYEDWWPEPRRRRVIAESRLFHTRKTTDAGLRMALGYRDARLVRTHRPRAGFFADVPVSAGDEAAWRATLPEIRVYDPAPVTRPRRHRHPHGIVLFARGDARLARRAVLVREANETPLRVIPLGDPSEQGERIVLPVSKRPVGIVGRGGRMIVAPVDPGLHVLAVRMGSGDDFAHPVATPGEAGTFIAARRRQAEGAQAAFTPAGRGGPCRAAPTAIVQGYLALSFSDAPGRRAARAPLNAVGRSRLMRAPYTANILVDWHRAKPRSRLPAMTRVAEPSEPVALRLMEAVLCAQAARDRDTISFGATRRLTYADLGRLKPGTRYGDRRGN